MTTFSRAFGDLPMAALLAIGVLLVVQLSLQIVSLLDLSRRATVPGGRKWVWVLIIIFGNLIGAIAYLALGRSGDVATGDRPSGGSAVSRQKAVDRLYGERDRR
jgi:hypothetical protein